MEHRFYHDFSIDHDKQFRKTAGSVLKPACYQITSNQAFRLDETRRASFNYLVKHYTQIWVVESP